MERVADAVGGVGDGRRRKGEREAEEDHDHAEDGQGPRRGVAPAGLGREATLPNGDAL